VLHQIGVGALGPVFRTYEPTRDRLVAVKVFRLDITPEQAAVLADELARATEAGLFHQSIVEPVAAGLEGTVAYRAEEYVAAESLDVAMRHYAPAALDKALPFITQLAAAIDFARAAGVGHGALHPRDIFVTPDEARATGFGVVDALDRLGIRAPVRRPYSPPERIAGEPWGIAADVFSLGAIAFELLTGRRPSGVGDQIGPLTGPSLDAHAGAIRDVLVKAMHENPADRYTTAAGFAAALAEAAGSTVSIPAAAVWTTAPAPSAVEEPALEGAAALEDFAAESPTQLSGESAREVARKVIAARKRQHKDRDIEKAAAASSVELPIEPPAEPAPPSPEPIVLAPVVAQVSEPVEPALVEPSSIEPPPIESPPIELPAAEPGAPLAVAEPPAAVPPLVREVPENVVAVDEFRLREASSPRERSRPRAADRMVPDRVIVPKPPPVEPVLDRMHGDLSLTPHDEPVPDRPRVAMFPRAVMLILGLALGYPAGYIVGNRESGAERSTSAQGAAPAPSSGLATPGTSGQTPPTTFSEASVERPAAPTASPTAASPTAAAPAASPKPVPPALPAAAPRTGQIVVTSSPSRASVTVNGVWSGRTPLTLTDRPFGTYVVRVVEPGFETELQKLQLSSKAPTKTMTVTLRPNPAATREKPTAKPPAGVTTGEIFVDSRPQGARVFIDGKLQGLTPLRLANQAAGSYVVRLELADHQPWTDTTRVTAGDTARVTGSLDRIR
jgi:hypothetical protein